MKIIILLFVTLTCVLAHAAETMKMSFKQEDLTKVIEFYSKVSGQKFVVDPGVRGKVSIFIQEEISVEEAFNQLSSALALNGYAISKQGDTMIIGSARNIQRNLIEVGTTRPSLKPERMYTWIYELKFVSAAHINRDLRILTSKDGEMSTLEHNNSVVITDFVSNLNRIGDLLEKIDRKAEPAHLKIAEAHRQNRETERNRIPQNQRARPTNPS